MLNHVHGIVRLNYLEPIHNIDDIRNYKKHFPEYK